ncbi:MAG: hypothetical protein ACK5LJ_06100 [Paracoccus sp. (in: a-proteobacteria)]
MTDLPISSAERAPLPISRPGLLFAVIGLVALIAPLVQFKANRIVAGEGVWLDALGPAGWVLIAALTAALLAGIWARLPLGLRLALGCGGVIAVLLVLGATARALTPEGNAMARVAPASGFWLLFLAFALMAADALSRMRLGLVQRWLMLIGSVAVIWLILWSGWLDQVSVMREYAARRDLFAREAIRHLVLAFGSLGLALLAGLPLGVLIYQVPRLRRGVLGSLNILQTIPSLALFGIMIPIFGWIAANVPGAAAAGIAGIGLFPALVALFL